MIVISLVKSVFLVYEALIFARAVLSWIPHDPRTAPLDILYAITDPLISTCREILYSIYRLLGIEGRQVPLDFSPLLALLFLILLSSGITRLLLVLMS